MPRSRKRSKSVNQPKPKSKRQHLKMQLQRLVIARADIQAAIMGATSVLELAEKGEISQALYFGLWSATVISYGRPFTQSEQTGSLPNKWFKFDDPLWQSLHDGAIAARMQSVAHSDPVARIVHVDPPGVGEYPEAYSAGVNFAVPDMPWFAQFRSHAWALNQRMTLEMNELLQQLYGDRPNPGKRFIVDFSNND